MRRVLSEIGKAALEPDQRIFVEDRSDRQLLLGIAKPLNLGDSSQTHFMLTSHWADHFARLQAQGGIVGSVMAGQLRSWMDAPRPMGLTEDVKNLVILAFAAQADRTPMRNGAPASVSLERIDDQVELREQPLPSEVDWAKARERAGSLFGLTPPEVRKGATVANLAEALKIQAAEKRIAVLALAEALKNSAAEFSVSPSAPRLSTLRSAQMLVGDLVASGDALTTVKLLAQAELETSEAAVSRCLGSASNLRDALNVASWDIIISAASLTDHRRAAAQALRNRLAEALEADEHAVPLAAVLAGHTDPRVAPANRLWSFRLAPARCPFHDRHSRSATVPFRWRHPGRGKPGHLAFGSRCGCGARRPARACGGDTGRPAQSILASHPRRQRRRRVSPLLAPDRFQIERELDRLIASRSEARVLGLRSPTRRAWPDFIDRGEVHFRLAWCASELELRERLDEADIGPEAGLVLLTPLDDSDLADDVRARLYHARLARTDRWAVLRGAFQARGVDPRLGAQPWLADLLIAHAPATGSYPPVASGVLDLETAWAAILDQVLLLPRGPVDLVSLMRWTVDGCGLNRLAGPAGQCTPSCRRPAGRERGKGGKGGVERRPVWSRRRLPADRPCLRRGVRRRGASTGAS